MSLQLVKNAIDTNAFISSTTTAGYINPILWNTEILTHVEDIIVVSGLGKVYDDILNKPGTSFYVTVGAEPTAASALTETTAVTIDAYSATQITFTPTEYGAAYQISDKEARRGFYDVAQDMVRELGYRLAKKREAFAINLLQTGAGNAVVANGVASSALASTDTIDFDDIMDGRILIMADKLIPKQLVVSVGQYGSLLKSQTFRDASQYGGRETILGGEIKLLGGLTCIWSNVLVPSSSKAKALLLAVDAAGRPSFGIGRKKLPSVASQRDELGRFTNFVAVEEWDMKVLRANGICTIETYASA